MRKVMALEVLSPVHPINPFSLLCHPQLGCFPLPVSLNTQPCPCSRPASVPPSSSLRGHL